MKHGRRLIEKEEEHETTKYEIAKMGLFVRLILFVFSCSNPVFSVSDPCFIRGL
jgi:hypothetical protein